MGAKYKCIICNEKIEMRYIPMKEWNLEGSLCSKCYSKKLNEFYPGDHTRVNKHLD